jgi:hypothetical protein
MGATRRTTNIWGPFAGYGSRRHHVAWLLEGRGDRADELLDKVTERFRERGIPQAEIDLVDLTGRGVEVEVRPFYRIKRGLATVWLYIARFGEDLYVSQVSYIKGPISVARVIMTGALALLTVIFWVNTLLIMVDLAAVASTATPFGETRTPNGLLLTTSCCTGPLGSIAQFILLGGLVFSAYKFLTEKDFLALLRARPSEFQVDDIVSMERAVGDTVRQAADAIGIERELLAPERAYRAGRRLI